MSYKKILLYLDTFFFQEKEMKTLGLFRILWFGIILIQYFLEIDQIHDFYGPHSLISLKTSLSQFTYPHLNLFQLSTGGYGFTYALYILYGLSLISSILGYYSRFSFLLAFVCMVSLHQRNIWLLSSAEVLVRLCTLYLIFSSAGTSFSLDSLISGKNKPLNKLYPVWPLRLLQIQLSVVYLWTFWHKLKGESWFDGSAVYYATRLQGFSHFSIPYFMDSKIFLSLSTWLTLIIECFLGLCLWIKELRLWAIIVGVLFHLSIEFLMSIPYFEWIMITLLVVFIKDEDIVSLKSFCRKYFVHFKFIFKGGFASFFTRLK